MNPGWVMSEQEKQELKDISAQKRSKVVVLTQYEKRMREERKKQSPGRKKGQEVAAVIATTSSSSSEKGYLQQLLWCESETSKTVTLNPNHIHHFMQDIIILPNSVIEEIWFTFHKRIELNDQLSM